MSEKTTELSERARALAGDLYRHPQCIRAGAGPSCLTQEDERPLTRRERDLGWQCRPFDAYSPDNLCLACRAYWHVECGAQALHRLACMEARQEAEGERQQKAPGD